jgi:hypothetical protein
MAWFSGTISPMMGRPHPGSNDHQQNSGASFR